MENNYNNIVTIKFAQAEQPKFEEKRGKGYIEFGAANNYPNYLLRLYNESPKHGAIVKGKANYIYGKGFDGIQDKANTKGESWNTVLKRCIKDDEIFGGYYLMVVYNLLGKIKDVHHLAYHKVRTNKEENEFFVKDDWEEFKGDIRKYKSYNGLYDKEHPVKVLFVKQYDACTEVYPLPNYFQGLNYIESDVQVARHILGNAKDGFSAGTMIQFFNGEPQEEQKASLEKGLKKKLTGSDGEKMVIVFSKSGENPVQINNLGNTMLTKEDFTNVNNLIQQEIFASHQITSPMLFGIKTDGQLGGRSEIQDAYEIFNNTYVNERQQAHEETFAGLLRAKGVQGEFKITPVQPLGFALKDEMLLKIMPREYFLDELGIDEKYYPMPAVEGPATVSQTDASGNVLMGNDSIKNLSGRQFQGVMRIVNKFIKGQLNKEQAALMLKNGFAFTDADVDTFLGVDSDPNTFSDEADFALLEQFSLVGDNKEDYEVLSSKPAREVEYFADVKELNQLESNILNLIKKDKMITADVIATTLKQDLKVIETAMESMQKSGLIVVKSQLLGEDLITERTVSDKGIKKPPAETKDILLRYSYDGPHDSRNRPFCAKLMELNRLYSRADIENISMRLGYSVWDRRGGWFTEPDGSHRPYCRHEWFAVTVIKKK